MDVEYLVTCQLTLFSSSFLPANVYPYTDTCVHCIFNICTTIRICSIQHIKFCAFCMLRKSVYLSLFLLHSCVNKAHVHTKYRCLHKVLVPYTKDRYIKYWYTHNTVHVHAQSTHARRVHAHINHRYTQEKAVVHVRNKHTSTKHGEEYRLCRKVPK